MLTSVVSLYMEILTAVLSSVGSGCRDNLVCSQLKNFPFFG
jgi:hypothetical protein